MWTLVCLPRAAGYHPTLLLVGRPLRVHPTLQRAPVGEGDLFAGDELEEHGLPARVRLPGALQGGDDVARLLDPLRLAAHRATHLGVVPTDIPGPIAVV